MERENPFRSPKQTLTGSGSSPALLVWSVAVVFGCVVLGGLIGLGLGGALGALAPGYYRAMFSRGTDPGFDPLAVGIGQGLTQGVGFGGAAGLVLVALFYWYRIQSNRRNRV